MKKLEKYTGTKTYMFPNGTLATPEVVAANYSAITAFAHIIETDEAGEVMFAVQNLSAMRSMHGISNTLSENEAILAIQEIINTPPPALAPTAEERMAAALEFQNLLSMEDIVQ